MTQKYYTLIAFKPEDEYYCGYEKEVHPALLIREDNLSREEIIKRIADLSKKSNSDKQFPDIPFNEFHIFEFDDYLKQNFNDIQEEAKKLTKIFNLEIDKKEKEKWDKENLIKSKKDLESKRIEYEKLKILFEKEYK